MHFLKYAFFQSYDFGRCPHFDTAEIYKTGNPFADGDDLYNEQVLAPFLATVSRDSYTIATKFMPFKYGGGKYLFMHSP